MAKPRLEKKPQHVTTEVPNRHIRLSTHRQQANYVASLPDDTSDHLRDIVLAAGGLNDVERERLLRCGAGEDSELLERARRRMSRADAAPAEFMSPPAAPARASLASTTLQGPPPTAEPAIDPQSFADWDRFRVGERLGAGGMGEVFIAFDRRLKRTVALKFLRQTDAATNRRFLREAEAQARVAHDNVLTVHDTGSVGGAGPHAGRPYIALPYVDATPLTELEDEPLEARVKLLIGVAEGLHAAHREGLVHRDVKPSNVLVERGSLGRLKPYVMDFGLAKPVRGPDLTASGVLLGTPHYMAPEQLARRAAGVDRRTDVYGLGATMYRVFSGGVLFPAGSSAEVVSRILRDEPERLRARAPAVPAELEAIVMKCLEKDPQRRYPSARAVAEDLQRFLDGVPVQARTATLTYRLAKTLVRHKALVAVSGTAVILLLALLAAFAVTAGRQAREIALVAERAELEAERAEREAAAARQLSDFMIELFEVSEPGTARGNTVTAREILDRGAERVELELAGQPLAQAAFMEAIGGVYMALGLYEPAEHMLQQGLEIARRELGDDDVGVAGLMGGLAGLYREHGELERAEPLYLNLQRILAASPRAPPADLGSSLEQLAALYADRGDFERAETLFKRGLEQHEEALGPRHPQVALGRVRLARLYADAGDYERAEDLYLRGLEVLESAFGSDHPEVARASRGLATTLAATGRLDAAVDRLEAAREVIERVVPDNGQPAAVCTELSELYRRLGDLEQALAYGVRAVAAAARYAGTNPASRAGTWRVAAARLAYGDALAAAGDPAASDWWRGALAVIKPENHSQEAMLALDLHARLLLRLGRVEDARPLVESLLARGWRHPPLLELSRRAGLY